MCMSDLLSALFQSMGGKVNLRWADTLTDDETEEERIQKQAEMAVQALRDSFYGKEDA